MANFDLGLAKCRIRDSITSAKGEYFRYIVKNDFDIDDETNIYVKNFFELEEIRTKRTDNCTTEEEINNLMSRVAELKKFIIEKENENDSIKTDRITVVIDGIKNDVEIMNGINNKTKFYHTPYKTDYKTKKDELTLHYYDLNVKMYEKDTEKDEIKVEKGNLVEA